MPWVHFWRAAVSDREGTLLFNGGLNGQAAELSEYGRVAEVPTTTLDALAERYGPPGVVFLGVGGSECRALVRADWAFAACAGWMVEIQVGRGLGAAGGPVLAHFPAERFARYVHSEPGPGGQPTWPGGLSAVLFLV
jgi:hypothetical protein